MSIDTVNDITPRIQYEATAGQTVFAYPFPIFQDSDLVVDIDGAVQTLTTHYAVSGAGDDTGGNVTLVTAATGGEIVTIYRDTTIERSSDFQTAGPWFATDVNDEFDRLVIIQQELRSQIRRALRLPISAEVTDADLEMLPANFLNKYLTFDAQGRPTPAVLSSATMTRATIGELLYPQTSAEASAGVTPTNYFYPPGHVSRYGTNATPGTTDMTAAINAAADVCREGNYILQLPPETCLVSSSLDFSGIRVVGTTPHAGTNYNIQATSAQFNVITTTGNSVFENFAVHGGWDGVTAGQSGDTFYLVGASNCYNVHFINIDINNSKRRGVYWEVSGYGSMNHVNCIVSGLHGLEIYAASIANLATTVYVSGQSRFSDCPNGYSVKLTECVSIAFNGCIMENSSGILLAGGDNRAISFNDVYQENSGGGGTFLNGTGSAGSGLSITNCYGASKDVTGLTSWENVFFSGNSALTLPPIPLAARVTLTDGAQGTTSTTGGVSVTAAQVTLGPGTYLMWGTVQTVAGTGSNLLQSACELTGSAAGTGRNTATDNTNFRPGADEQTYNPGGGMDHRLSCFNVVQLTSTTTMYLRTYLNFSGAGSMTYHGFITSILLS